MPNDFLHKFANLAQTLRDVKIRHDVILDLMDKNCNAYKKIELELDELWKEYQKLYNN